MSQPEGVSESKIRAKRGGWGWCIQDGDVSQPEGVGESKNRHEGAGCSRCVQKGDTSQPKGVGMSKIRAGWGQRVQKWDDLGQKGQQVQKRGRMGSMHPKMGHVV